MKGESVQSLLDELTPKRDRLSARRFEPGDEVSYKFDSETTEQSTVVWSDAEHTKLKSGSWKDINTAQLTSTSLEELNQLIAACNTLLMQ